MLTYVSDFCLIIGKDFTNDQTYKSIGLLWYIKVLTTMKCKIIMSTQEMINKCIQDD